MSHTQQPMVSFVVPCFKLGHLLKDCVDSILAQTYRSLEVLILDDCSPDNTPEVARSFADPRVTYVRNEQNLGHLRNYNKGIGLARGKYIWLVSADDRLRGDHVLRKYVDIMESHPNVGFVFCSGIGMLDGKETGVLDYSLHGDQDAVFPGHSFLAKLLQRDSVLASSGMVRRDCYERVSLFPVDMPYAGDWYLWCIFSLHYDVGYCAEPMVNYRRHSLSMTNILRTKDARILMRDDIAVPWRIKQAAEDAGIKAMGPTCLDAVVNQYVRAFLPKHWSSPEVCLMPDEFENSVSANTAEEKERRYVRARVYAEVGDHAYWDKDTQRALKFYVLSLRQSSWRPSLWLKCFLLWSGAGGGLIREWLGAVGAFFRMLRQPRTTEKPRPG